MLNTKGAKEYGMKKVKKGISPMDAALGYLTSKPRTALETELYLDTCQFGDYEIYSTMERLKELGYINDKAYAENFIISRLNTKPVSRRKLYEQLKSHKLSADIIDDALLAVTDEVEYQNALAVAEKFYNMFDKYEKAEQKQRTIKRLVSRGYGYETVKRCISEIAGNCDDFSEADMADCGEDDDV